eukprot:9614357-Heterocapsa_arctica.AAC.1
MKIKCYQNTDWETSNGTNIMTHDHSMDKDKGNRDRTDHRGKDRRSKCKFCGPMWTQTGSSNQHIGKHMRW